MGAQAAMGAGMGAGIAGSTGMVGVSQGGATPTQLPNQQAGDLTGRGKASTAPNTVSLNPVGEGTKVSFDADGNVVPVDPTQPAMPQVNADNYVSIAEQEQRAQMMPQAQQSQAMPQAQQPQMLTDQKGVAAINAQQVGSVGGLRDTLISQANEDLIAGGDLTERVKGSTATG